VCCWDEGREEEEEEEEEEEDMCEDLCLPVPPSVAAAGASLALPAVGENTAELHI